MTFCASILNDITAAHGSVPTGGVAAQFRWLEALDELSKPKVARLLLTTYKNRNLPGGDIIDYNGMPIREPNNPELNAAMEAISKEETFMKLFGTPTSPTYKTFEEMCRSSDGGVDYLFEQVARSTNPNRKAAFKQTKYNEMLRELSLLVSEALPSKGDEDTSRTQFLETFASRIENAMNASLSSTAKELGFVTQASWVSYLIRSLQSVSPAQMPTFTNGMDLKAYIFDVVNSLGNQLEDRTREVQESWYQDIGLADNTELLKLIRYLAGRELRPLNGKNYSIPDCINMWCLSYFLDSNKILRLPVDTVVHELAVLIENIVWHGYEPIIDHVVIDGAQRRGVSFKSSTDYKKLDVLEAIKEIDSMNDIDIIFGEDDTPTPHETAIINPFVEYIRSVAKGHSENTRGIQAGDAELASLVANCPDLEL